MCTRLGSYITLPSRFVCFWTRLAVQTQAISHTPPIINQDLLFYFPISSQESSEFTSHFNMSVNGKKQSSIREFFVKVYILISLLIQETSHKRVNTSDDDTYLPMKRRTIPKDKDTNIHNNDHELLDNERNNAESDGLTTSNSSKEDSSDSSDSDLDVSPTDNRSRMPSVFTAGQSSTSRNIEPKHSTRSNRSSKSKPTHYFRWKEKYSIMFKWLKYDPVSGVAHCGHSGCNMYRHHFELTLTVVNGTTNSNVGSSDSMQGARHIRIMGPHLLNLGNENLICLPKSIQ